jgi:hypothetical protein
MSELRDALQVKGHPTARDPECLSMAQCHPQDSRVPGDPQQIEMRMAQDEAALTLTQAWSTRQQCRP